MQVLAGDALVHPSGLRTETHKSARLDDLRRQWKKRQEVTEKFVAFSFCMPHLRVEEGETAFVSGIPPLSAGNLSAKGAKSFQTSTELQDFNNS